MTKDFEVLIYDAGISFLNPLESMQIMLRSDGLVACTGLDQTDPDFMAQIDGLLDEAAGAHTYEECVEKCTETITLMQTMYPWIPIVERSMYDIYNADLQGIYYEPYLGGVFLEDVTIG